MLSFWIRVDFVLALSSFMATPHRGDEAEAFVGAPPESDGGVTDDEGPMVPAEAAADVQVSFHSVQSVPQ